MFISTLFLVKEHTYRRIFILGTTHISMQAILRSFICKYVQICTNDDMYRHSVYFSY